MGYNDNAFTSPAPSNFVADHYTPELAQPGGEFPQNGFQNQHCHNHQNLDVRFEWSDKFMKTAEPAEVKEGRNLRKIRRKMG